MASKQQSSQLDFDVIIVGAGVIGASAALTMQQLGYRTVLIDSASKLSEMPSNIRATALGTQAKELLESLNVWQQLNLEQANPYSQMHVWDENSQGQLSFDAKESGLSELGFICDHFALQRCLQGQCENESSIEVRFESSIEQLDQYENKVEVQLKDGSNLSASLLIAADGVSSFIRQALGITTHSVSYQQTGIVAQIETEKSHQDTAWQRFLEGGPLALLPLANGNCSIVWTVDSVDAGDLLSLSEEDFQRRLEMASQGILGEINLVGKRYSFPLKSVKASQYLHEKVLLIGDAAHGIHPLAGQGANLGLADVAELKSVLQEQPDLNNARRFLRRYERARKVDNYATDSSMSLINAMFKKQTVGLSLARETGMNLLNKSSFIKSVLIAAAQRSNS